MATKFVSTPLLHIAYEEQGNPQHPPVILLHGFPDDIRSWDDTVNALFENLRDSTSGGTGAI